MVVIHFEAKYFKPLPCISLLPPNLMVIDVKENWPTNESQGTILKPMSAVEVVGACKYSK